MAEINKLAKQKEAFLKKNRQQEAANNVVEAVVSEVNKNARRTQVLKNVKSAIKNRDFPIAITDEMHKLELVEEVQALLAEAEIAERRRRLYGDDDNKDTFGEFDYSAMLF